MMEGFGEIMTLDKIAKHLKIGKPSFYKAARDKSSLATARLKSPLDTIWKYKR